MKCANIANKWLVAAENKMSAVLKHPTVTNFPLYSGNWEAFFPECRHIFFTSNIFPHNRKIVIHLNVYFSILLGFEHSCKRDSFNLKLLLYKDHHLKKLHDYLIHQQLHDSEFVKLHHNSNQGILPKVNLYQKKVQHTCPLNIYFEALSNVLC